MSLTTQQMRSITSAGLKQRITGNRVLPAIAMLGETGDLSRVPFTVTEGNTAVGTMRSRIPRFDGTTTYSIIGGEDQGKITINESTGALSFLNAPTTLVAGDYNGDNIYLVQVRATHSSGVSDDAEAEVTVEPVAAPEAAAPPVFSSSAAVTITTSATAVTTVVAAPPPVEYSISGGADQAKFAIDSTYGLVTWVTPPDYDTPTDADTNNAYVVEVTASDGTREDTQTITVTVTAAVSLGSELWAQPAFDAATGFTVVESNWTIENGYALSDSGLGAISMYVLQAPGLTIGHTYRAEIALHEITNGWVRHAWDGQNLDYDQVTSAGVYVADFVAARDQLSIYGANSTGIARVLHYSVKEVL